LIGALYISSIIVFSLYTPESIVRNIVGAMGAVTGVIGSMVAGYFGVQLGSASSERAEITREEGRTAERQARDQNGVRSGARSSGEGTRGTNSHTLNDESSGGYLSGGSQMEDADYVLGRMPRELRDKVVGKYGYKRE
jgi:hypothetical protein